MDKIKIYSLDESTSVTLPRCRISIGKKEVAKTKTMASGKVVKDIIGMRKNISAEYGYIPAADIVTLNAIVSEGGFHKVEYPSIGGDDSGKFEIAPPSYEVFSFVDGVAVWNNVKLSMSAQEVE